MRPGDFAAAMEWREARLGQTVGMDSIASGVELNWKQFTGSSLMSGSVRRRE
jgi:hypothetical protein